MNRIIEIIQQKYGEFCGLLPPLEESQYELSEKMLPEDLFEIIRISNGIYELMTCPNVNDDKPFVMGHIIFPFEEIRSATESFSELFGAEGTVFAGNGAGGYYVIDPAGAIYLYEYTDDGGQYRAENLQEYFTNLNYEPI